MRVLLFQSPLGRKGVADALVFPIGLCCVATALDDAGHFPKIVDLNLGDEDPCARLEREIATFKPDIVGISQRNIDSTTRKALHIYHTQLTPLREAIERAAPGIPTLLGGPGFTQAGRTLMARYGFDYGIHAEAEEALPELLQNLDEPHKVRGIYWRADDGQVHYTGDRPVPDFSRLPFPRRHYIDWSEIRREERKRLLRLDVGIETTRGCPQRCASCNYPYLNGKRLRRKPPQVVADEISYLKSEFGILDFTFTDSRFNEDPQHAREVCQAIIRKGVRVRWVAWLGFDNLDEELLTLMREAGCHRISFSPDGLLQPSLDRMLKDTTTEAIDHSIQVVRNVPGIRSSWMFFCTPPGTSRREQLLLLKYYAKIHGTLGGRGRMVLTWCRVEEGTHFEQIAYEDGVLPQGIDLLPSDPAELGKLFYVPPGFERWSRFWDRFLDAEMQARVQVARVTSPLRKFGFRDLTPGHLKGKEPPALH